MNQAGGTLVDGDAVAADSPENLEGLEYVQKLHDAGVLKFPSEIDAGWGGEALGAGKAAMVIEGPWIKGIQGDFPDTNYAAYELPAGPAASRRSLSRTAGASLRTRRRGMPLSSSSSTSRTMTSSWPSQTPSRVIPSTESAAASYADKYPENASFVAGNDYAVSPVNFAGSADAVADFNAKLEGLSGGDAKAILSSFQEELQAAYDESQMARRSSSPQSGRVETAERGLVSPPLARLLDSGRGIRGGEARYGWAFVAPAILIIGVFLVLPIFLALFVSFSDWNGRGSPLANADLVGGANYSKILLEDGLAQRNFATAIRNNLSYVIAVVPLQTALAMFLAVQVNRRLLRARGFFRTAFYFPSVTSSIAITTIFLFLFTGSGAVNAFLSWFGAEGPNWFAEPAGLLHGILGAFGVGDAGAVAAPGPLGLSWWDWLAGPSSALSVLIIMAIFTTSGTFMLLFLAALQNVGSEIEEAAMVDGANSFRTFFSVTLPMLKPTALHGAHPRADRHLAGVRPGVPDRRRRNRARPLLMPAYLAYLTSFEGLKWGQGAAISFVLFGIIVALTLVQRWVLRDRDLGAAGVRRERRSKTRQDARTGCARRPPRRVRQVRDDRDAPQATDPRGGAVAPDGTRRRTWARRRTTLIISYLILGLALIYIYPFLISIAGSFKTDADATQNSLSLIPQTWSFSAYERLFTTVPLLQWTGNSAIIAVIVTLCRVFFDSLAGYALSRLRSGAGVSSSRR